MSLENFDNASTKINLDRYIPTKNFRVVNVNNRETPGGISEIPVEISLKDSFYKKIHQTISRSGHLYGFVRMTPEFKLENSDKAIKQIEIYDWNDEVAMFFIYKDNRKKKSFTITTEELVELIENARYPYDWKKI